MTTAAAFHPGDRAIAAPPSSTWWNNFDTHRELDMPPQSLPWTCSACAVDWVLRASGLNPDSNREWVVGELGYPQCINADVGLADTQCAVNLLSRYAEARQEWVGWDRACELCNETTGLLNSTTWQHFVAIRGTREGGLWVANSAPGYRGITDTIDAGQFAAWAGSWQIVWLER